MFLGGSVKGVKVVNNQNAALANKYQISMGNQYGINPSQLNADVAPMPGTAKNNRITSILSDYEKTKSFNQELMRNIGSPKGPIFARVGGNL